MRIRAFGDVLKVWLYAAAVVALGAWLVPLLFNAGKALAEVSSSKTTNGALEWLGAACQKADFPQFFTASVLLAAVVLIFPWLRWLRPKHGEIAEAAVTKRGPWWRETARGFWHTCAGFLLVVGVWFALAAGLFLIGWALTGNCRAIPHAGGRTALVLGRVADSFALAGLMEVFFRGVVMAVFLRAMRPAFAICMNAVIFALALAVIAPHGLMVADPEDSVSGFRMLRLVAGRMGAWQSVSESLVPLLALGAVLAHARWRTAALWLPVGLHAGWLFAGWASLYLLVPTFASPAFYSGNPLPQGWLPTLSIVIAGVLACRLTPEPPP